MKRAVVEMSEKLPNGDPRTGMRREWLVVACLALAGVVSACGVPGIGKPLDLGPGTGTSYQAGYTQGCHTGNVNAGVVDIIMKNEQRFRNDPDYRQGWLTGHAECYENELRYSMGGPGGGQ